jgi:large conductance mechanosensitive channel
MQAGGSDGAAKSAAVSASTPSPADAPRGNMVKDFRQFLLRGNVVDLAVGVVIGAAFGRIVSTVVSGLITPVIAAIGGDPDFSNLAFTINDSQFKYGLVVNAIISFLIIATAVFFLVVRPVNALMGRFRTEPDVTERVRPCPECLSEIPRRANRCAFCTAEVGRAPSAPPATT